ncbi:MAG: DnaJ domain-containing protein [Verrucomicrobiae bacterium]|nr:DnaJ domain-containing protein [Verrucomicrobiae bacterium]
MQSSRPDHYATLGLHRRCTEAQIRAAYRILAKQHHPDVNGGAREAVARTQALNAAYETLSDPDRRQAYDAESAAAKKTPTPPRPGKAAALTKEIHLGILEFLRGAKLDVHVNDPGNLDGAETYELVIPPETAPGARFKIPRTGGGFVVVRAKAKPDFRFKVRGSDLRCDLKINAQRALQGGVESVRGATGNFLRVPIPKKVASGEIIRLPGEGLPKTRGGRGDLLVRITYRPEVRITRASGR